MNEQEILDELKRLTEDEKKCNLILQTSRDPEKKDHAKASLGYIAKRQVFLKAMLNGIRMQRGLSRT
jgi:hypothetical protein